MGVENMSQTQEAGREKRLCFKKNKKLKKKKRKEEVKQNQR